MSSSSETLARTTASCLVTAISLLVCAATRAESPVFGTIGIDPFGALTIIQGAAHGEWFEGSDLSWDLSIDDAVVPSMISDFDKDGYDDFIIRSDWGMGIIGNDADDNIVLKALTPYGTDIGDGWVLSASDEVVAVGQFGRAESARPDGAQRNHRLRLRPGSRRRSAGCDRRSVR